MSEDYNMRQCTLSIAQDTTLVAWVPEKYAVVGKALRIKTDDTQRYDEVWFVRTVGDIVKKASEVSHFNQDYKHQREVSDI
jgi:hypothetical protein